MALDAGSAQRDVQDYAPSTPSRPTRFGSTGPAGSPIDADIVGDAWTTAELTEHGRHVDDPTS